MNIIIVKSQKELDVLPQKFSEYTIIRIESSERITISVAWGNSSVEAWGNSSVVAWGNSSVVAYELAIVIVYACLALKIYQMATAFLRGIKKSNIKTFFKEKTAKIIVQPVKFQHSIKTYLQINKSDKKGNIILYKSVNPKNNKDFQTGMIEYKIGETIICPDWINDNNIQCGNGLHLCKTPLDAFSYNNGKLLKCEANIKDINIYADDVSKIRCKKVKVICEVDKKGNKIN